MPRENRVSRVSKRGWVGVTNMSVLQPTVHLPRLQDLIKQKAAILIDRRASTQMDKTIAIWRGWLNWLQIGRVGVAIREFDNRRFEVGMPLRCGRALNGSRYWNHEGRIAVDRTDFRPVVGLRQKAGY